MSERQSTRRRSLGVTPITLRRQAPSAAEDLVKGGGIERLLAGTGVVGEFPEHDASIYVVHVDANEIQIAAELVGQGKHLINAAWKLRIVGGVGMTAPEWQA